MTSSYVTRPALLAITVVLLCLPTIASAQPACVRGIQVLDPVISNTPDGTAGLSDVDGDGRTDWVVSASIWRYTLFDRGGVYQPVPRVQHTEFLSGLNDQNRDGWPDFINYGGGVMRRVHFGRGDGTSGTPVDTVLPPFNWHQSFSSDFDQDGLIDFLDIGTSSIRFSRGVTDGTFVEVGTRPAPQTVGPQISLLADFDGDGSLDVATVSDTTGWVTFHWTSHPFDLTQTSYPFDTRFPENLEAADLEGDGTAEILGINRGVLYIVRGANRKPTFERRRLLPAVGTSSVNPTGTLKVVGVTDFDADGHRDLIAEGYRSVVYVFRGLGDGGFAEPILFDMGGGRCVRIRDLDRDGINDLVTHCGSPGMTVLSGGKDPVSPRVFRTMNLADSIMAADVNGDGLTDLVTTARSNGGLELLLGRGNGSFESVWSIEMTPNSFIALGSALADLDHDGIPDLAIERNETIVRVLFGNGKDFGGESLVVPVGHLVGATSVDGKNVLVARTGGMLQLVTISSTRQATVTPFHEIENNTIVSIVEVDGDPEFELLVGGRQILNRTADGWKAAPNLPASGYLVGSSDFNGDGRLDLALWSSSNFEILISDGTSYRRAQILDSIGNLTTGVMASVHIADFDNDGLRDVLYFTDKSYGVLRNVGGGTFEKHAVVASGGAQGGIVLDADRDGWIDFVGMGGEGIHVARNVCASPRTRISATPSIVYAGDRATIHVHALPVSQSAGGAITIRKGSVTVHQSFPGLHDFATTSWTTPPLAAGLHSYVVEFRDQFARPSVAPLTITVVPRGPRRRAAAPSK